MMYQRISTIQVTHAHQQIWLWCFYEEGDSDCPLGSRHDRSTHGDRSYGASQGEKVLGFSIIADDVLANIAPTHEMVDWFWGIQDAVDGPWAEV